MSRTKGSRNATTGERRAALLHALRARLSSRQLGYASVRELATAAQVSVPTLAHHFGNREDIVTAVLEDSHQAGQPFLKIAATPLGNFGQSVRQLLEFAVEGHRRGVAQLHVIGLTEGLGNGRIGSGYLQFVLEPTLQAIEVRLAAHVDAGEMRAVDVRHAAIALLSPLLLAQLHQGELGGAECRPLDIQGFVAEHADAFVRAYSVS